MRIRQGLCVELDVAARARGCVLCLDIYKRYPANSAAAAAKKNPITGINKIHISSLFSGRSGDYLTRKIIFSRVRLRNIIQECLVKVDFHIHFQTKIGFAVGRRDERFSGRIE